MTARTRTVARNIVSTIAILTCLTAPAAPPSDGRLGVATHFHNVESWAGWEYQKVMPLIADLGVGWIRDDLNWSEVEKTKGHYEIPPRHLAWIKAAHQHGLKVILILYAGNDLYPDHYDPDAYAAFAAEMARQLADDVDCFEIHNEPSNFGFLKDFGGNWNGLAPDGSINEWVWRYLALLNRAAPTIKAANPRMKVIGLGSVPPVNFRQLAKGVSPDVDGITDHPYSMRSVPEIIPYAATERILKRDGIPTADARGSFASQILLYRQLAQQYHGPKEIWLTEWGFPTYQPITPQIYAGVTPSAQAKYIQRRLVECLGLGVNVSILYDFKDDGTDPHNPEHNFGLVDTELKPKPSYDAVQKVVRIMHPWKAGTWGKTNIFPAADRPDTWPIVWDGSRLATDGTIATYQFVAGDGGRSVAIWSTERADGDLSPRTADIEIIGDRSVTTVSRTDMLTGETRELPVAQHAGVVLLKAMTVPDHPVLLVLGSTRQQARQPERRNRDLALLSKEVEWTNELGREFPGARGAFTLAEDEGKAAGTLCFDFAGGGQYVAGSTPVAIGPEIEELRFSAKSANAATVLVRIIDSTDQYHQWLLPYDSTGRWQTLHVPLTEAAMQHFGGSNDGRIHLPSHALWLGVQRGNGTATGQVLFSDVQAIQAAVDR